MKYLTPQQYILADDGISLSDVSAITLARTIQRAESDIDAFQAFDLRLGGFEPHTGWVQSQWDARTLKTRIPNYPVPMRQPLRYRIQVSNISTSGAGFMATINNNDVAMNVFDQYVEIVPLQSITYSLAPVLVSLGLRPPLVQLDYEAGYFLPVFGEVLIDGGLEKTYYAARGFWATAYTQALSIQPNTLPPIPAKVYKNGVPLFAASLSSALTAGVAITSLPVNALTQAINTGSVLILNDGSGVTLITVTVAAPGAAIGATAIPINSFTPAASYGIGTVFASGYAVNYTEGQVIFSAANALTDTISADYTYTIPDNVRDATILQTSFLLGQRTLNKLGMQGVELARSGEQQVKRPTGVGAVIEDNTALCLAAAHKLINYQPIPIA